MSEEKKECKICPYEMRSHSCSRASCKKAWQCQGCDSWEDKQGNFHAVPTVLGCHTGFNNLFRSSSKKEVEAQ